MARKKLDPHVRAHLEWLGYVQPTGLVVSAAALVQRGAILPRNDVETQRAVRELVEEREGRDGKKVPWIPRFDVFARRVLGWRFSPKGYAGTAERPIPDDLVVALAEFEETLRPDWAVIERDPGEGESPWQLLVMELAPCQDFDRAVRGPGGLELTPHGRLERLLRETGVPAGLLWNGCALRLVSAPRGENSGWLDFRFADMLDTAGRPIAAAMKLLLSEQRLLALPREQRLATLLAESRRYQNLVSERLAEQVLHALYELLRGFQAADERSGGRLLADVLEEDPEEVYRGLLTVLLRLVFLLYAEERGMFPDDEVFLRSYSLAGLWERLRDDAARYPDTMGDRFGAWGHLLALFRIVHDGARAGRFEIPPRHGALFDPDRFPFLEGRPRGSTRQVHERIEPPLVPDGTVYRALEKLLVLDGERISYRALDVEQIGSVYETMMGFRLERATGTSLAIRAQKKGGAPTTVDLDRLLATEPGKRKKWLEEQAHRKIPAGVAKAVKQAASLEDLHQALDRIVDHGATPDVVPGGSLVLQPSEERRKTGSHYTPRALTEPIVRHALEPVLERLRKEEGGRPPRPEKILELKVLDPAMGSGAFLVEACRQLAEELVASWHAHGETPEIPPDEDELVHARRLVARRCLYGVDRNPLAVDLAKVSLWLVTLAREHPFTFLDHALRHGDSLVGLTRKQIEALDWKVEGETGLLKGLPVREALDRSMELRRRIREAGDDLPDWELRDLWDEADHALGQVRLAGDLVVAAFFEGKNRREREARRLEYKDALLKGQVEQYRPMLEELRHADPPLVPFHWEIEFPEVFDRGNPGFDVVVGNPPFGGKNTLLAANVPRFLDWLKELHEDSHGNADLVAHFFRRSFSLVRRCGTFGLIATNTIAQGDTRNSGLRWICTHDGEIYRAVRRVKWPGQAAVVVSVVHVHKGPYGGPRILDGREVPKITAFLFHRGGHDDPVRLRANAGRSFQGSIVLGMGFTFDDTDTRGVATPTRVMNELIRRHPHYREVIFPYIGGQEVNTSPTHAPHRYVINFGDRGEQECRERYPDLMAIVEEKVRPEREAQKDPVAKKTWWQFLRPRRELYEAISGLRRVLVINCGATPHVAFAFLSTRMVYAHSLAVFVIDSWRGFCVLQARPHEIWARFFGSSMKDDLRYTPSDCFETFPFPSGWEQDAALENAGKEYYDYRARLMAETDLGLTKTYNRFHDPGETDPGIVRLRELHEAMDRVVLDAYGWTDIPTDCDFFLDYEVDEEEEGSRRKKPWRYRWPDDVRDEVLARLLELNAERAAAERRAGPSR